MTIARFLFKWLWNLINFKKHFKLTNQRHLYWVGANILCGLQGGKVKVTSVHTLMLKNTNRFFVFQDSSIPDVCGDICPCVCDHQTAYIAYWHLYWVKKIKQYCLKFHAPWQHWIGPMQTRWQRPYNVLYARIARARLESITQSAFVAYSLSPAKPCW